MKKSVFEKGSALVEYALLVALLAVTCITSLKTLGAKASQRFSSIGETLSPSSQGSVDIGHGQLHH